MKTNVYLGLINSGKGQALYYARTKRKTIAKWKKRHIVKNIHDATFELNNKKWERNIVHTIVRQNDIDNIDVEIVFTNYNEHKDNKDWIWQQNVIDTGFINTESGGKGRQKGRDDTRYPEGQVLWKIDPSIMDNVDLLLLRKFEVINQNKKLFQTTNNIIPYKTNLTDSAISKLDKFGTHRKQEYGNKLLDVYYIDKKRVWDFLDCYLHDIDDTIKLCQSNDVPYTMFNLDEDSYENTFGWGKIQYRDLSHHKDVWQNEEKYDIIENMAKEYVSQLSTQKFYHLTHV